MTASPDSRIKVHHQSTPALPAGFRVQNGRLSYHGIDLLSVVQRPVNNQGRIEMPTTPLFIRYLPTLRSNYQALRGWFDVAKARTNFPGELTIAYASKANPSEPVVRTILQEGAAHECSSSFDVDLLRFAESAGWIDRQREIFANGFKIPAYTKNLLRLRADGFTRLTPIFDDIDEIAPFAESGLTFNVGLRSRTASDGLNRFGMTMPDMEYAAWRVLETENLTLTTFHAMQTISMKRGAAYTNVLRKSLRDYASLRRIVPTMRRFSLGGGLPGRNSGVDFQEVMTQILQTVIDVCQAEDVPVPDLIVEPGRYLVQDHACQIFSIVKTKRGNDGVPYYMIDGSIMSSFPDAWALGDKFPVLPLNHWDAPFDQARLAGLTCDRDDIYPTHRMDDEPLDLPTNTDGLLVGFFECGAYQETLGGMWGAKHCLLPDAAEMILDVDGDGSLTYAYVGGQSAAEVLDNLGYEPQQVARQLERIAL